MVEEGYDFSEFVAFMRKHGGAWLALEKSAKPQYEVGAQIEPTAEINPIRCCDSIDALQDAKLLELGPD